MLTFLLLISQNCNLISTGHAYSKMLFPTTKTLADCSFITETLEARQASGKYNQNVSQNVSHAPEARQATRQTEAERCESRYASI